MGGLGNQMFGYAFARSLQLKYCCDTYIDISDFNNRYENRKFLLDRLNISNKILIKNCNKFNILYFFRLFASKFPKFTYKILLIFNIYLWKEHEIINIFDLKSNKNYYFYGYWQSLEYFKNYDFIIKNELKVNLKFLNTDDQIYNLITNNNSICVHVRRGDYIKNKLLICDLNYFNDSIKYFNLKFDNPLFFIFSDDIIWCKNNIINKNSIFIDNNYKDYEELQLMSMCKHYIISNSSFSWWAQHLSENKNKIVIAPDYWLPGKIKNECIYENQWMKYSDINKYIKI